MAALDAVEKDSNLRVLVTRMSFGPDKLNGLALFRMLDHKRIALGSWGTLRAVFIGRADYREDAEKDGVFLLRGADPLEVVEAVRKQLKPARSMALRMAKGPILWEGAVVPAPRTPPVATMFSFRTEQLLRSARQAMDRTHAALRWRMTVREPFAGRAIEVREQRQSKAAPHTQPPSPVAQHRHWSKNARAMASGLPDSADRDLLLAIARRHEERARLH